MLMILILLALSADRREARALLPNTHTLLNQCDDIVPGEIIIQFKQERLQYQSSKARGYLKQVTQYRKARASGHIKTRVKNFNIKSFESALDIENSDELYGREVIQAKKTLDRRAYIDELSLTNSLTDVYVMAVETLPNPLLDWVKAKKAGDNKPDCASLMNLIKDLEKDPNVVLVEPNYKLTIQSLSSDAEIATSISDWSFDYDALWGLERIKADQAWSKTQGQDTIVAVIDTGVDYNHPDLWDNIWVNPGVVGDRNRDGRVDLKDADTNSNSIIEDKEILPGMIGYDFADSDYNTFDDKIGHGTHVSGIIAAKANNNRGIVGSAPRARIMPVKIFDSSGNTSVQTLAKAVLYAAKMGADVANMSITGSQYSKLLAKVFAATSTDMISVAAAGNSGKDISGISTSSLAYPANFPEVISVAASTEEDTKASFSNYGFNIDVAAPGGSVGGQPNILSTDRTSSGYKVRAGTSMATPYVTALVALLKSQNSNLKLDDVRNIMRLSAKKINSDYNLGAGLIQADKAMQVKNSIPRTYLKILEYQYPTLAEQTGIISIQGSVTGSDIVSYEISIASGTNPSTWDLIAHYNTNFMKKGVLHRAYDTHEQVNGIYTLRLAAKNSKGDISYDDALIKIAN